MTQAAFKGSGAAQWNFSGAVNAEGGVTSLQGSELFVENGIINLGQLSMFDSSIPAIRTGTGARAHFSINGVISGKGNTGVLARAGEGSQIVNNGTAIAAGAFYTAASTTNITPIQAGTTSSAVAIPLDANMNGVFTTQ
jgi:hypothetical protein